MTYRNTKILKHARGQSCTLQIPAVCNGDITTTVACHANFHEYGKGKSMKANDWAVCFGCASCHKWLDEGPVSRDEKRDAFYWAFLRTLTILFDDGVVR